MLFILNNQELLREHKRFASLGKSNRENLVFSPQAVLSFYNYLFMNVPIFKMVNDVIIDGLNDENLFQKSPLFRIPYSYLVSNIKLKH